MPLSHSSSFLTRLLLLCLSRKETCGFRPGMAPKGFWCACLVVLRWLWQLDHTAFFIFCSFRPQLCSKQCSLQSHRKKGSSWPLSCFDFTGILPDPSWPICLPNTTLPPISPSKLTVPTPKYLYSYITSKYILATLKTLVLRKHLVSYLEETWECLSCTLL